MQQLASHQYHNGKGENWTEKANQAEEQGLAQFTYKYMYIYV